MTDDLSVSSSPTSWIVLAHLLRPQGRKGEVLADLETDFPDRLVGRKDLFLASPGFTGDRSEAKPVEVIASWLPVGKNKGRVVLHLAGIDSISSAEVLSGLDLIVSEDQRTPLDQESVYISDLIGCALYDEDTRIGDITDVQFSTAADGTLLPDAPALLIVRSADDPAEILIPFVKAFVKDFNPERRRLTMSLPLGLVDVNR
ncbi:ribosome maturation factor RimM [Edaphobacter albus]|uniref:ribosome maturation factor RimM n=1 Tax=Edaphobacter sp. 4G125 TaxID=2763071 RepID=UPI001645C89E|nr:ribosome maturation factor RimM [Edaphobacter sp. 4G125]QNI35659.1 16S rRNA processing protein RimM [Edaphobacter sp. 4G125]